MAGFAPYYTPGRGSFAEEKRSVEFLLTWKPPAIKAYSAGYEQSRKKFGRTPDAEWNEFLRGRKY